MLQKTRDTNLILKSVEAVVNLVNMVKIVMKAIEISGKLEGTMEMPEEFE